jgi:hypothetical protein
MNRPSFGIYGLVAIIKPMEHVRKQSLRVPLAAVGIWFSSRIEWRFQTMTMKPGRHGSVAIFPTSGVGALHERIQTDQ